MELQGEQLAKHLITTGLYMIPKLVHIKLSCLLESNCAGMLISKMEPFIIRKLDVVGTFSSFFLLFVPKTSIYFQFFKIYLF